MINIFFVPGMFGSTIEYVLRSYTKEYTPVDAVILDDGSMHSYHKESHLRFKDEIAQDLKMLSPNSITTPIYPFRKAHLPEILEAYREANISGHNILVHADSDRSAELNMLFQYHKIVAGQHIKFGLGLMAGVNSPDIVTWNPNYQDWSDMKPWEFREWFSLFYVPWFSEWIDSPGQVPDTFLKIKNVDVLFDTKKTLLKIIDFCGLTLSKDLDPFINEWRSKQQYILDEFKLLDQIIEHTIANQDFSWKPINIISEAIIQQRLRKAGYEIKCHDLNTFPTDSKTLYFLLEKC